MELEPRLPDLLARGVLAGLVGTSAMTAGYLVEHRLRPSVQGPLDYDDSDTPGLAAARVLGWLRVLRRTPGPAGQHALSELVGWGYGSVVGAGALPFVRRLRPVPATLAYGSAVSVMAAVLFPLLGRTPPPWRWRADEMATSLTQHFLYAAVVVATLRQAGVGPASAPTN